MAETTISKDKSLTVRPPRVSFVSVDMNNLWNYSLREVFKKKK